MALYAIGDLHLSLGVDKPMDIFGGNWVNYMEKIEAGFHGIGPEDVCVLCGDISWGMQLDECLEDFLFIKNLPGKKIILKGNHDYWWNTVTKIKVFFEANGISNIDILHNNCYIYKETAVCGTRGWLADEDLSAEQNKKIMAREVQRLRSSLDAAENVDEKICFFHYPPRFKNISCRDIITVMNENGVRQCYYGHLHGDGHRHAVQGEVEGIEYNMISADHIDFTPQKIR